MIERDVPLAPLTSWLVGGPAQFFAQPRSIDELREALIWARTEKQPLTILSGGTNVLVADSGVQGLVVCLRKLTGITTNESNGRICIESFSGTSKSELLKTFLKHKLEPALFLAGLPGDVGGGVAMNAGVGEMIHPREFVEITDWIEVLREVEGSFVLVRILAAQLAWTYRHCEGWRPGVITRVGLSWPNEPITDILSRVKQANQVRLTKQPLDMPSCGSVFVNPVGFKAGQMIEQSGLKGYTVGGAQVSKKHANFIVNHAGGTAADIEAVIEHVRATVKAKSGIELKTEVVYLGNWTRRANQ